MVYIMKILKCHNRQGTTHISNFDNPLTIFFTYYGSDANNIITMKKRLTWKYRIFFFFFLRLHYFNTSLNLEDVWQFLVYISLNYITWDHTLQRCSFVHVSKNRYVRLLKWIMRTLRFIFRLLLFYNIIQHCCSSGINS